MEKRIHHEFINMRSEIKKHKINSATRIIAILYFITTASIILLSLGAFNQASIIALSIFIFFIACVTCKRSTAISQKEKISVGTLVAFSIPNIIFSLYLYRSILAPPRAWDALVYHLPRAAAWLQEGSFNSDPLPQAINFYHYFSPAGDLLFAWAMGLSHSDSTLFAAYIFTWLLLIVSILSLARSYGIDKNKSYFLCAAALTTPALISASGSAYVDNMLAALLLISLSFFKEHEKNKNYIDLYFGLASLALAALTKITALPILCIASFTYAIMSIKHIKIFLPITALVLLPLLAWHYFVYKTTGSITYPFGSLEEKLTIISGDRLLGYITSLGSNDVDRHTVLKLVLIQSASSLGLGPLSTYIIISCLLLKWKFRDTLIIKPSTIIAATIILSPIPPLLSENNAALITLWAGVLGRHLIAPFLIILIALINKNEYKYTQILLPSIIFANLITTLGSLGISRQELSGLIEVAPITYITTLSLIGYITFYRKIKSHSKIICALIISGIASFNAETKYISAENRFKFFETNNNESFEIHPTPYKNHVEHWMRLDSWKENKILFSCSFTYASQWFIYPYYGSKLQNSVTLAETGLPKYLVNIQNEPSNEIIKNYTKLISSQKFDAIIHCGENLPLDIKEINIIKKNYMEHSTGNVRAYYKINN